VIPQVDDAVFAFVANGGYASRTTLPLLMVLS